MSNDVYIRFVDNTEIVITDAEDYKVDANKPWITVVKNKRNILFNFQQVKFIGTSIDIDET